MSGSRRFDNEPGSIPFIFFTAYFYCGQIQLVFVGEIFHQSIQMPQSFRQMLVIGEKGPWFCKVAIFFIHQVPGSS